MKKPTTIRGKAKELAEARAMARLYETGLMANDTLGDYGFSRSAPRQPKIGS
jgi:hypothetical protein